LIAGVLLFGIASLACAVAPTLSLLLLARFVQGASAAMLMPNSLAILALLWQIYSRCCFPPICLLQCGHR
jgi:MFS family permease